VFRKSLLAFGALEHVRCDLTWVDKSRLAFCYLQAFSPPRFRAAAAYFFFAPFVPFGDVPILRPAGTQLGDL